MLINSIEELGEAAPNRAVIIGGGTVGIYLAVQLARKGQEVVIVEAGNESHGNFSNDTFSSVGFPHRGIKIGRSRSLGGTSNLWGGQLVEYQPADFNGRDWLPDSKWPVGFEELSKYYGATYKNLGLPQDLLSDKDVLAKLKTTPPQFDDGVELFLTRWLKIPSLAVGFRKELESNPDIKLLLDSVVVGFDGTGERITAVKVHDKDGNESLIKGNTFVLAAGTIETVRLMLHAASLPSSHCPWRGNPNLGKYFQDHVGGRIASVHPIDYKRFTQLCSSIVLAGHKFQPKIRFKNETLEKENTLNVHAMFHFESSISENLVFLKQFLKAAVYNRKIKGLGELTKHIIACGKHLPPLMWRYIVQNRVFVPSGSKISFVVQSEQTPLSSSRIEIDETQKDVFGLPKVKLDWKLGEFEFPAIKDFAQRCKRSLHTDGLAELKILPGVIDQDPEFFKTLTDNYHHVGGARMGWSNRNGVVDSDLRVFGTENCYVLGASSFRTTSNANTTFTALVFATRLAEKLAGKATA